MKQYLPLVVGFGGLGGPLGAGVAKVATTAEFPLGPFFLGYYGGVAGPVVGVAATFVVRILRQKKWTPKIDRLDARERAIVAEVLIQKAPIKDVATRNRISESEVAAIIRRFLSE